MLFIWKTRNQTLSVLLPPFYSSLLAFLVNIFFFLSNAPNWTHSGGVCEGVRIRSFIIFLFLFLLSSSGLLRSDKAAYEKQVEEKDRIPDRISRFAVVGRIARILFAEARMAFLLVTFLHAHVVNYEIIDDQLLRAHSAYSLFIYNIYFLFKIQKLLYWPLGIN